MAAHKGEVSELQQKLDDAHREVLESSRIIFEQNKYEDRVKLIKKMHEEEVSEIKRVNKDREEQLE